MSAQIRRREFITLLGGAAAAWPLAARTQQAAMPVVGFLRSTPATGFAYTVDPFRQGLNDAGFVEGKNVAIEYRWADNQQDRLPGLAADLKWLELLREILPQLSRLSVLWDPSTGPVQLNAVEKVGSSMGLRLQVIEVREAGNIEQAIRTARKEGAEALLLLLSSPMFGSNPAPTAKSASENRFPAITMFPEFAQTGGLMAYGPNISELFRQAGAMVAKVLAGAAPADLPIERPVRFQLVINLTTAKALGVDVPLHLQQLADEVIE